jgi:hypothetical protein
MKRLKKSLAALVTLAGAGLIAVGCSDGAGPPTSEESPPIPAFAKQNCLAWSCESGRCGYDTAYPPGACCILYGNAYPAPKPSCRFP